MLSRSFRSIVLAFVSLGIATGAFADAKRVALIFGNSSYSTGPLANPVNDAQSMAKSLQDIGFQVSLGTDVDRKTMYRMLDQFGQDIQGADIALFYYSGHGVQLDGENYLIPVKADITRASDIKSEAVQLQNLLAAMTAGGAATNVVILDACRNNPFPQASRGMDRGLAVVGQKPPETLIIYATEAGDTADDGSGTHGVFTGALLQNIARHESFSQIFFDVNKEVRQETNEKQKPVKYDNLTHDVYFSYLAGGINVTSASAAILLVSGKKVPIKAAQSVEIGDLQPGEYTLTVTYDDGTTDTRKVTVEGGKTLTVSFAYQRSSLTVSSVTAGTLEAAGQTLKLQAGDSLPLSNLQPGPYVLKITYDDGKTETRAVTLEGGKSLNVSFTYKRGALTILSATDGTLEMAGKSYPVVAGQPLSVPNVAPGDYVLKITYDDGKSESRAITVENGKTLPVAFAYQRGSMNVTLSFAGTVDVNGKTVKVAAGDTGSIPNLAPGDYVVKVTYDDGKLESRTITVEGGKTAPVSFSYAGQTATAAAVATVILHHIPANVISVSVGDNEQPVSGREEQQVDVVPNTPTAIAFKTSEGAGTPFSLTVTAKGGDSVDMEVPAGTFSLPYLPAGTRVSLDGSDLPLSTGDDGRGHSVPVLTQKYSLSIDSKFAGVYTGDINVSANNDVAAVVPEPYLVKIYTGVRDQEKASWNRRGLDRTIGWAGLATGAAGAAATGLSYLLGAQAYKSVQSSTSASATSSAVNQVKLYGDTFVAGAVVAGLGFVLVPTFLYLASREPVQDDRGIKFLDRRIAELASTSGDKQ